MGVGNYHILSGPKGQKERRKMNINAELLNKFKMKQTAEAANLKTHINEVLKIGSWEMTEYVDVDGTYHNVLSLAIADSKDIYRTEVRAFIEKFKAYIDVFGECPVEERPCIKITGKTSKKRNEYISFEIVDESGNPL